VVLANGSMSSNQSRRGRDPPAMVEGDVVDCMVALPGQLFYSTQIPACLWFLAKDKSNGIARDRKLRDRRGEVLFIDARKLGTWWTAPGASSPTKTSPDRRHLPRLAAGRGLRRRAGLLQIGEPGGDPVPRPRPDPGPLCGRRKMEGREAYLPADLWQLSPTASTTRASRRGGRCSRSANC
jgi:hypothetical protein